MPLSTITRVDVVRQTSVERIWAGLLLTAGSLLSIAILIGSLRTDRLYLHPLLWLGAFLGVPTGLVLCFNRRQTTVTFVVNDQRFSLPLSDRRWKQDGKQILEVLKRGGVRCEFYGCDPPGEDTASEP